MLRHVLPGLLTLMVASSTIAHHCIEPDKDECPVVTNTRSSFDQNKDWKSATSMYAFSARDIYGNDVDLNKYRGHVAVIVNVASNCGLTDTNYKELVELHEKYGGKNGLQILAFPSNQFGGQEPGSSQDILDFIKNYNVKFDVFEKVDVNGEHAHPLWKWLKSQAAGFIMDNIKWNFSKFIIDKEGKVVSRFAPTTSPLKLETELKNLF